MGTLSGLQLRQLPNDIWCIDSGGADARACKQSHEAMLEMIASDVVMQQGPDDTCSGRASAS